MIRILLAHSSRLVCDSLRTALDKVEDVFVVGCATTAEEFYFLLPHATAVLLGTELEGATAFDLLDETRITHPQIKMLVFGVDKRPETIIRYVEAGASGYILQEESVEDVVQKLKAANEEKAIVSPTVAAAIMERLTHLANLETSITFVEERKTHLDELTGREQQVLHLISDGCTNKEIANELVIECGTVKNHVHRILKKLDVNNRHEAASILQMSKQSSLALAV